MNRSGAGKFSSTLRLILVPALISLIVTLWRLTGELLHWSARFYNPEAGGMGAIVGITWLAPVFGIYFAFELVKAGQKPPNWRKALGLAILGGVVLILGAPLQTIFLERSFLSGLVYIWLLGLVAAGMQLFGWPQLVKTLLAYGLAARLPIILIMALAMRGGWGTHYDAKPPGFPEMDWLSTFLWLGFFPQLTFWVGSTIVMGALCGVPAAALLHRRKPRVEAGSRGAAFPT